jgi:hypothetical protein
MLKNIEVWGEQQSDLLSYRQRLSKQQKRQCWSLLIFCMMPIAGAFCFNAGVDNPLPGCLFQAQFGFPSPSCGLTRSFMAVARGDIAGALMYHLFGPVLFLGFTVTGLQSALELWCRQPLNFGYRWLAKHLGVVIYGAPLFTFSFFGYYFLRLYVRFSEMPFKGILDDMVLWQGFVTGAKLL